MLKFLFLLALAFFGNSGICARSLTLEDGVVSYVLGKHLDYLEDASNDLSIAEVQSEDIQSMFRSSQVETPNFGHTRSSIWIRVKLKNSSQRRDWILEVRAQRIETMDVYLLGEGFEQRDHQQDGVYFPFSRRAVPARYANFSIKLPPGGETTLFMRAKAAGSMSLPLVLWQPEAFIKTGYREQMVMGIYYGTIVAIFLVNLIAFVVIRDIVFVYYLAYLLVFGSLQFALNGHFIDLFPGSGPSFAARFVFLFVPLATCAVLQFVRVFLDLKKYLPWANRLIHGLSLVSMLSLLMPLATGNAVAIKFGTAFLFFSVIVCLALSMICLRKCPRQARYFLIAWTGFLVGVVALALKNFNLLPSVFLTEYGMQIGSFFEFILLTYALADRVKILRQEREKIQQDTLQELESRVQERTRELVAQREVAERATQFKSEFLANMSHEIRTPMNAIVGYAHLALRTELSTQQKNYLAGVTGAARSLLGLLDDVLDFSKFEAGKLQLEQAGFNLGDVVGNVSAMTALQAQDKGIALTFWIDPGAQRWLVGDALRFGQVLLNLVNNAIKFTEQGEVAVSIQQNWRRQGMEGGEGEVELAVRVRDTGIGISEEASRHLFQSFNQADRSITRRYGGTGLGLAICKQLVEAMGGGIGLRSAPGQGSTFTFTAVFGVQAGPSPRPSPDRDPRAWDHAPLAQALRRAGGARVLIVEDQEINRQILQETLEAMGIACRAAVDGLEAVRLALDPLHPTDLLLMDLQMPRMDGLQACAEIRRHAGMHELPIIALTAHAHPGERQRCLDAGMNDYLTKPLEPGRLAEAMARWIGHAAASRPPSSSRQPPRDGGLPAALPGFEGMDAALARVGGNGPLLRRLIVLFGEKFGGFGASMRRALQAGSKEEAVHLAHMLKGNAASLGARRLADATGALLDGLEEGLPLDGVAALCARVDADLGVALSAAAGLRDGAAAERGASLPDAPARGGEVQADARAWIGEVADLAAQNDVRAGTLFNERRGALRGAGLDDALDRIGQALDSFDFKAARAGLSALAAEMRAGRPGDGSLDRGDDPQADRL